MLRRRTALFRSLPHIPRLGCTDNVVTYLTVGALESKVLLQFLIEVLRHE
jgi:hypothetical protein